MPRLVPVPTLSGGNLDVAVSTRAAIADFTTARGALLDRLAILAAGGASELSTARAAALDRLINDLTVGRAANLDNLNATVGSRAAQPSAPTFFTTNDSTPVNSAQVLDTGALAAGNYEIVCQFSNNGGTSNYSLILEYRNAANSATTWSLILADILNVRQWRNIWIPRMAVALNERFRVSTGAGTNGTTVVDGYLYVHPIN